MVICLELGADLHMAQLMPLPLTVFCFSEMHLGSPGKRAVKRVCVCVCVCQKNSIEIICVEMCLFIVVDNDSDYGDGVICQMHCGLTARCPLAFLLYSFLLDFCILMMLKTFFFGSSHQVL